MLALTVSLKAPNQIMSIDKRSNYLFGHLPQEMLDKSIDLFRGPETDIELLRSSIQACRSSKTEHTSFVLYCKNGQGEQSLISFELFIDKFGNEVGCIVTIRCPTEIRNPRYPGYAVQHSNNVLSKSGYMTIFLAQPSEAYAQKQVLSSRISEHRSAFEQFLPNAGLNNEEAKEGVEPAQTTSNRRSSEQDVCISKGYSRFHSTSQICKLQSTHESKQLVCPDIQSGRNIPLTQFALAPKDLDTKRLRCLQGPGWDALIDPTSYQVDIPDLDMAVAGSRSGPDSPVPTAAELRLDRTGAEAIMEEDLEADDEESALLLLAQSWRAAGAGAGGGAAGFTWGDSPAA